MYKLSNLAAEDFERIFEYTLLNFGVKQADDYTVSMHNALLAITEQPLMGHECPEIAKELRRHNHHKHAIFYKKQTFDILPRLASLISAGDSHYWAHTKLL
ncbi:MAG: type II toxin-antitoxin system RelE/ParE family toxin [Shewanella indica]|jgi:toxin ParE1/3/4|uniref:type II toxin-antitoxin system RelE/ParE family toxin n=2 Tax=Shewanellaceae TaxID=267890 RepID=UPI001F0E7373|nr:type II toxin-antitoxin system RelE/ParE family toxin [Shewanella chilikensis]